MKEFPFPSREAAYDELRRDVMYNKLLRSGVDIDAVAEKAWNTGADAARDFYEEVGGQMDFQAIARDKGLTIRKEHTDQVIAGRRYFSEYLTNKREMVLYTGSIEKWAVSNAMSVEDATNLILAHEFFHHLENTRLGFTSRQTMVPMLSVFGIRIGSTGIRALSEIGAHAFARTYFQLAQINPCNEY